MSAVGPLRLAAAVLLILSDPALALAQSTRALRPVAASAAAEAAAEATSSRVLSFVSVSRDESSVPSVSSVFSTRCTGPAPTTSTVPPTWHRVEWLCVGPKAATRQPVPHSVHNAGGVPSDEGAGAARPSYPLPSTTGRAGANRTDHSPTSSQETTPLGGGLVGLCEGRPSRSHKLYKSVDSERIFYPSDDSLLPGPGPTGTEGSRAPGRGGAVLASPVPNNSDIDIFVGGTRARKRDHLGALGVRSVTSRPGPGS